MKESYGGIVNLVFLIVFLIIVIGVLGLTVTYTKAFRMKDKVISVIEEYEGSGCDDESGGSACMQKIATEAANLGYRPPSLSCGSMRNGNGIFCFEILPVTGSDHNIDNRRAIYRVVTQVDISFPIVEKIMGIRFFQVSGDTEVIELPG